MQIEPRNQQERADQAKMLEEAVGQHRAGATLAFLEAVGKQVRREGQQRQIGRPRPAHDAPQDHEEATSSPTIVASASGAAGARPKCRISATAAGKSRAFTRPPCIYAEQINKRQIQ